MITTRQKIKVFISSACGNDQPWKEKYNIVRAGLKALIETTQFAEVYLFENEGSSTLSAGKHYTSALKDCDVCIFLIDNKDGVPPGVQIEVDTVKKHKIKSLYYFCDQYSKDETPLQKSLMGAEFSKSSVVHSFEELILSGTQGLIDDLVLIYRSYCKGRIDIVSEEKDGSYEQFIPEEYFQTSLVVSKDVITKIDKTKQYFSKIILGDSNQIINTSSLDDWCCRFLPVMFEQRSIEDFNLDLFLKELNKFQTKEYHAVIKKRWEAIQSFFCGELESCISLLNEALKLAKNNAMPDWIIKDILIDLRNQKNLIEECNNNYFSYNDAQIEIDESSNPIHYPLLDRFESEQYQRYIEESLKEKIKSPYTVTFGDNLAPYVNSMANICILAVFNGSLTHLLILYRRLEYLSFHLCEKYSDWQFRRLLLKMAIINFKTKDIDGIIRSYEDILSMMNSIDAKEIFEFSKNRSIPHHRLICNLEAFKAVGYFLSDDDFDLISKDLIDKINVWILDGNRNVAVGSHIFDTLSKVELRISADEIAIICCNCFENKLRRWFDDIYKLLGNSAGFLSDLSHDIAKRLISNLINVIENERKHLDINSLELALCSIRKVYRDLTDELNLSIKIHLPEFYEGRYRLETSEGAETETRLFITKYVQEIEMRNNTQGVDGSYVGYANKPHLTLISLLKGTQILQQSDLLDLVFVAASNTLLAEKQTIGEKCEAIELLIFLCKRYPDIVIRNNFMIQNLKSNRDIVEAGYSDMFSKLSESTLRFSLLLLYNCFGDEVWLSMIERLHYFDEDIPALVQANRVIMNFLEANEQSKLTNEIEAVLLQVSLKWCNSKNFNVRYYAIRILFQLLRNQDNSRIICNQLVKSIDNDNVYIKNLILRQVYRIKSIDPATYNYILQKASLDTNYVVRKVYSEISK